MKIGIITFYKTINYGAVLQAYALQAYLRQLGHQVFFIQSGYTSVLRPSWKQLLCSRNWKSFAFKLALRLHGRDFFPFKENFSESDFVTEAASLPRPDADLLIVGGDQMWNPRWCYAHKELLFLQFSGAKIIKSSYAVSLGGEEIPPEQQEFWRHALSDFVKIGVRERKSTETLNAILDSPRAVTVPDPVFLLPVARYRKLEQPFSYSEPYLFEYALDDELSASREHILRHLKLSHTWSCWTRTDHWFWKHLPVFHRKSVGNWLYALRNSDFVLTNSFHCVAFAILNHKPFWVQLKTGKYARMNCRVEELLKYLKLEQCMGDSPEECLNSGSIDWDAVDEKVARYRVSGENFLHSLLELRIE